MEMHSWKGCIIWNFISYFHNNKWKGELIHVQILCIKQAAKNILGISDFCDLKRHNIALLHHALLAVLLSSEVKTCWVKLRCKETEWILWRALANVISAKKHTMTIPTLSRRNWDLTDLLRGTAGRVRGAEFGNTPQLFGCTVCAPSIELLTLYLDLCSVPSIGTKG